MPSRINHIFKGMMRFPCAFKIKNSVKTPLQTVKSYKKGMVIKEFQSRQDFNHCIRKEQPPRVIAQSPTKPPKHSLKTIKFWSSTSEVWPNSTKVNEFCSINPVPEDLTFPFRHNCSSFLLSALQMISLKSPPIMQLPVTLSAVSARADHRRSQMHLGLQKEV